MTRAAETGSLKQRYPEVWKDTTQERNQCKKQVGAIREYKNMGMGLCFEDENDFDFYDDVENLSDEDK